MNGWIIEYSIVGLAILTVFNLWLSVRLIHTIKRLPLARPQHSEAIAVGELVPKIAGTHLISGLPWDVSSHADAAKALIFISSACDKCRAKLPVLEQLATLIEQQQPGVVLHIVSAESPRSLRGFLAEPILQNNTVVAEQDLYDKINPLGATPYYMFVDNENVLKASGMIGDTDWQSFVEQIEQGQEQAA